MNDRTFERQTEIKRRGKREFIPATSFLITVIGVRQRRKERKKQGSKDGEGEAERAKVNRTRKSTKAKKSQVKKSEKEMDLNKPFVPSQISKNKSQRLDNMR